MADLDNWLRTIFAAPGGVHRLRRGHDELIDDTGVPLLGDPRGIPRLLDGDAVVVDRRNLESASTTCVCALL